MGEGKSRAYKLWYAGAWPDIVFYINRAQNANFPNSRCENTPLIGRESPPPSVSRSYTSVILYNIIIIMIKPTIEPELERRFMFLVEELLFVPALVDSMCISVKMVSVLERSSRSERKVAPGLWVVVFIFSC